MCSYIQITDSCQDSVASYMYSALVCYVCSNIVVIIKSVTIFSSSLIINNHLRVTKYTPSIVTLGWMNGRDFVIMLNHNTFVFLQSGQTGCCQVSDGRKALQPRGQGQPRSDSTSSCCTVSTHRPKSQTAPT